MRNISCPCGSGRKYKDCHYGKSSFINYERDQLMKNLYEESRPKKCIFSDEKGCEKFVKSHSIQRKRILSNIAENGYVVGQKMDLLENSMKMGLSFEKIGINLASIFTGLCLYHDTILFKNIDNYEINPNNTTHNFELALRIFLQEYSKINHVIQFFRKIINNYNGPGRKVIISHALQEYEKELIFSNEILERFKQCIFKEKLSRMTHYGRIIDIKCNIALANLFCLQHDLEGNNINHSNGNEPMFLSVFPVRDKTLFIISHFQEANEYQNVMKKISKTNDNNLKDFINKTIAGYIENFFIKPSFWESIDSSARLTFEKIFPFRHTAVPKRLGFFGNLHIDFFSLENTNKLVEQRAKK